MTAFFKCTLGPILGNPDVTHSLPTAFECSGYGMSHAWVKEDDMGHCPNELIRRIW